MRGSPFRRTGPDSIKVHLRPPLTGAVEWAASYVRRAVGQPGSAAFSRLFPAIEEGAEDDPLATLERQSVLDSLLAVATASAGSKSVTVSEAEAWLQLLALALAIHMEEHDIRTDVDRDRLDAGNAALIEVVQFLQACLIEVLDEPT